jgi:hypothetical protein
MALPLLVPVAFGIAGLFGAGKAAKAAYDTSKANDIASSAQECVDQANEKLDQSKGATNALLSGYGKKKLEALDRQVQPFVALFKQLKNVEIAESAELEKLKIGKFSEVAIAELQHSCNVAHGALQGVGAGAVGGALTAFGAYSGTMMLASAGTGAAISGLSGVAATNATLAWLGGGTLAAGGMGVAGGTMVLGALVAGPALLIFGSVLGAKASKKLSEARANMEKAETFEVEVDGVCQKLAMIQEVTNTASEVLSSLRGRLRRANDSLEKIITEEGTDFSKYDNKAKAVVFRGVKYAQLVKAVIDTPILNESGELLGDATNSFSAIRAAMEAK